MYFDIIKHIYIIVWVFSFLTVKNKDKMKHDGIKMSVKEEQMSSVLSQ